MRSVSLVVVLLSVFALASPLGRAEEANASDKTLSPYFFVEGGDPTLDRLPLKSTKVHFDVAGAIADVTVTQEYRNEGSRPLHARYVFPASTRAAVHGLTMKVGDEVIVAQVKERGEARAEFEKAKASGQSATLLEQDRPNVFTMNVANILPGDVVDVVLRYSEQLVPTSGVYEFVYPTVVGPRYSNVPEAAAEPTDRFVKTPYLTQGKAPTSTFAIDGTIAAGMPVAALESPSHRLETATRNGRTTVRVADDGLGGNRDFILHYRLEGDRVQTGLLLYQGADENFFTLTVEPPKRVETSEIPPRDYVFIVDVSGSMWGFPLDTTKALLRSLIGSLRPTDRFNILTFSGGSSLMAPESIPATPQNVRSAIEFLGSISAGGGTELLPAVRRAMSLERAPGVARSFVVITDGYVAVEEGVFQFIRDHLGDANVFAFGIGSAVNRYLIEGVAKAGLGEPFVLTSPADAAETTRKFQAYVQSPVLTDVKVAFDGFDAYDVEPSSIPTVFADRPVVIHGKWRGPARGRITLTGAGGDGPFVSRTNVAKVAPEPENEALRFLWARSRIDDLMDLSGPYRTPAEIKEITDLGLRYNLLTQYTSFIAVQEERRTNAPGTDVAQPLPLPQGVSNSAVGESVDEGAEPGSLFLVAALAMLGLFAWHRRALRVRS